MMNRNILCSLLAGLALAGCARPAPPEARLPPLATRPTVGQEIGAVARNNITVTFAPGSARLSPDADQQIDVAARLFRDVDPVKMFSIGYSDPSGDEFGNIVLSARRAMAVKQALIARGIPPDRLLIQALGQSEQANADDPSSPENRRVIVMWRII